MSNSSAMRLNTNAILSGISSQIARSEKKLQKSFPKTHTFLQTLDTHPRKIREHAAKLATTGVLTGALLLNNPITKQLAFAGAQYATMTTTQRQEKLSETLSHILPTIVKPLTTDQEDKISKSVYDLWGINAKAQLENERLNTSFGYIGAEQHLPRYPGDTAQAHGVFIQSGITPGRGAWGYFTDSKEKLTHEMIQQEKYYVAVQTLYLPDWEKRLSYLRDWYKYRKVVVINPANGKTIVATIADSGPAQWTGKHFGGSPEVMAYLELNTGKQKGAVILFFVDESENKVQLGPIEYNISIQETKKENQSI